MRLAGKSALITGAGSGIGRQTALRFAREGAAVAAVDIDDGAGAETAAMIADQTGGRAFFARVDVSEARDCRRMIAAAEDAFGRLDILFNNAGISHLEDAGAVDTDEAVWEQTMNVNLKGVFLGCKYGIPALQRAGGGSVINTASFVALLGAATPQIAYTASKGGVLALSRELAVVHARDNIRVNALCPGPLRTELLMKYPRHRGETAAAPGSHSDGEIRRSRRDRRRGGLPRLGRVLFRHRHLVHGGWRNLGRLRDAGVSHRRPNPLSANGRHRWPRTSQQQAPPQPELQSARESGRPRPVDSSALH